MCTGAEIDREIGNILLGMIEPATLELSLAVQQELQGRLGEADRLRKQQVERVRYEADLARQRFMNVDPNNRLVASTLEAEWNERFRALMDFAGAVRTTADHRPEDPGREKQGTCSLTGQRFSEHMERPSDLAPRPQADRTALDRRRHPDQG